ncbi:MAG: 1-deoxy-D-xylulose-5-phosphate reductoisomerase [Methylophilaceae bacterium]
MKTISILGSTGSIGCNALAVIRAHPDKFNIFALSGYENINLLFTQSLEFKPSYAVTKNEASQKQLSDLFKDAKLTTKVLFGDEGYKFIAGHESVCTVVAAISGSFGLISTMEAAIKGKKILLANKESMVMAGDILIKQSEKSNGLIIPVDSEHNAIFQVIHSQENKDEINKIILTASGGPFRLHSMDALKSVTIQDALNHPNWKMGKKITIDSATMMNKGLEVIEAAFLFGMNFNKIDVLIHPQSIIHSLVEFIDGSTLTQLGMPDMKVPISYALSYPDRITSGIQGIDLSKAHDLQFEKPDLEKFRCLNLAYQCLKEGRSSAIILNAANEVAVEAFLTKKISFIQISKLIERVLEQTSLLEVSSIEQIFEIDHKARIDTNSLLINI